MRSKSEDLLLTRRSFMLGGGSGLILLLTSGSFAANTLLQKPRFSSNPFTLGVASGDPTPDGVVLWTRLAPDPVNGGGMPPEDVPVRWWVAKDEGMKQTVRSGTTVATAALGHSVHVELTGLEPGRWYWYRFAAGDVESPIGRTRTAPATGAALSRLNFAFISCQNWQDGHYTAFKHLATEELDLIAHLGDYIYEGGVGKEKPRQHNSPEVATLVDYRNRYALYKTDPHLQAVHAAFPWVVTWDDHEVENNYAGLTRANLQPPGDFRLRRAAAYQAYYEHQPLRITCLPKGPDMQLYRRLRFGNLADFHVLDTRQYRTHQLTEQEHRKDATGTIMGAKQEEWLTTGLDRSHARWNVIAQQVFMAQRDTAAGAPQRFSMDAWDGYADQRNRFMRFLDKRRPSNPIVLTGDVHANWVADLKADFDNPASPVVGTEFIGTSISSGGDGSDTNKAGKTALSENPHIKFYNHQRGYVRCTVTPQNWRSDYRVVPFVEKPGAPISTRASFVVENGKPGVQSA